MQIKTRPLFKLVAAVLLSVLCMSQTVWAQEEGPSYVGRIDTEDLFFDDFSTGLDPDTWLIAKSQWGGAGVNGGVVPENVSYTYDGVLVLTGNGDLYNGPVRGLNPDGSRKGDGKRTGAAIATRRTFASGSYEVRMKVLPQYGACSSVWTFYYNNGQNHEIDIELPGNQSFSSVLNTNWLTAKDSASKPVATKTPANDGEWHTYRFDWHTDPKRVDYYVDGVKTFTDSSKVPFYNGRLWLGVWFPDKWCGDPKFDTSALLVDYVKITPFHEAGDRNVPVPGGSWAGREEYPKDSVSLPLRSLLSNGGMENQSTGWTRTGSAQAAAESPYYGNYAAKLGPGEGEFRQLITAARSGVRYTLTGYGKADLQGDPGYLGVRCLDVAGRPIPGGTYEVQISEGDYMQKTIEFLSDPGTAMLQVYFKKEDGVSSVYADGLSLSFTAEF